MNRTQLEHIIRAATAIAEDNELIIIGSQAIHAHVHFPPHEAVRSTEADVYPRNHPERAELIEGAIGELSGFHDTYGYYAQGVSPMTAILPRGWEDRLVALKNENTGTGTGLCIDLHDLLLSKYAANREKDREFNRAVIMTGFVDHQKLLDLTQAMPGTDEDRMRIAQRIEADFANPSASNTID
ncbi:MAG: hypothetical protein E6Q43_04375 [Dokdonella sp.]|nr:MAG: hypothetical protein EYC71_05005 [Gammaproteobacteria bacterium]TXI74552.1 MAG: hypothetical protein E6Q43_04375 [Dokdonella sp.]